jgi:hypothetical protein
MRAIFKNYFFSYLALKNNKWIEMPPELKNTLYKKIAFNLYLKIPLINDLACPKMP